MAWHFDTIPACMVDFLCENNEHALKPPQYPTFEISYVAEQWC